MPGIEIIDGQIYCYGKDHGLYKRIEALFRMGQLKRPTMTTYQTKENPSDPTIEVQKNFAYFNDSAVDIYFWWWCITPDFSRGSSTYIDEQVARMIIVGVLWEAIVNQIKRSYAPLPAGDFESLVDWCEKFISFSREINEKAITLTEDQQREKFGITSKEMKESFLAEKIEDSDARNIYYLRRLNRSVPWPSREACITFCDCNGNLDLRSGRFGDQAYMVSESQMTVIISY